MQGWSILFEQNFLTKWWCSLQLWPLILKTEKCPPFGIPSLYIKFDVASSISFISILPARFTYYVILWPLASTLNNKRPPLIMVIKFNRLYDPKAYGSILSYLQSFPTNWCYNLDLRPLNNKLLPLIMVIKGTKLYDPKAHGLVSILPTRFPY
jgi:hypothetical protein